MPINTLSKAFSYNALIWFSLRAITPLVIFSLLISQAHAGFFSNIIKFFSGSGQGPEKEQGSLMAAASTPLLGSENSFLYGVEAGVGGPADEPAPLIFATDGSAIVGSRNPLGTLANPQHDYILVYTVQPGDVPSVIAENFGISLNTLLWANNIRNPNLIKLGDKLVILPVSGIRYEVEKGDTLESIAKKFRGDATDIMNFNGLGVGEPLAVGTVVIIPDGEITPPPGVAVKNPGYSSLPELRGYFLRPIIGGRKSRGLHGYNGVDLAQYCGAPVLSSAEGTVIITRYSGWNGGYGQYLVISHPNGTQTLYAHLSKIYTTVGQYVAQGSQVGIVGSTGNSTGCHVHFEVRGARNPF